MSAEIASKKNILVTDFHLLKLLLVVLGFGSQTNVCGFSRQNICSVPEYIYLVKIQLHGNRDTSSKNILPHCFGLPNAYI